MIMTKGRQKGTVKTGGRQKGSPNKVTVAVKECISKMLTDYTNSETFMKDFAVLEPKERLIIAEKLMNYVVPKMQSVAVEDVNKDKNSTVAMLIQLRDGNRNVIPNLCEEDEEGEENEKEYE